MEYQMDEIYFLISLAWAEGGIDVGGPPTLQKSEN